MSKTFYTISSRSQTSARLVYRCCKCCSCMAAPASSSKRRLSFFCRQCSSTSSLSVDHLQILLYLYPIERRCPGFVSSYLSKSNRIMFIVNISFIRSLLELNLYLQSCKYKQLSYYSVPLTRCCPSVSLSMVRIGLSTITVLSDTTVLSGFLSSTTSLHSMTKNF